MCACGKAYWLTSCWEYSRELAIRTARAGVTCCFFVESLRAACAPSAVWPMIPEVACTVGFSHGCTCCRVVARITCQTVHLSRNCWSDFVDHWKDKWASIRAKRRLLQSISFKFPYPSIYRYMYIDLRARRHLLERDPCELHCAIHA
jgi:hypothetical protein